MLIDGTGAEPVEDGAVVIEEGTIIAVGPEAQIALPSNARVIDAHGGTIMPGVIDPHTHFTHLLLESQDVLSPWLQTGVTTVQDLGTRWYLVAYFRSAVASLEQPPRVQFAGPIITAVGGYPNNDWSDYGVATVEEARAFVAQIIDEQDVEVIKIAIERGYGIDYEEEGLPVLTPAQVAAITDEAHKHGRIVIAHVTDAAELEIAVENGVDVLAHAPISPVSDQVLRAAIAKDVPMITTVGAWADIEDRPYYALQNAVRYWELGGRIVIGSDYPFAPPSMPLDEFRLLSRAGVPNMSLIVAATNNAAGALGRADDLGTLEVGKVADVIVVAGDPIADIEAMAHVESVVLEGRVVKGTVLGDTPTVIPSTPTNTPAPARTALPTAVNALPVTGMQSGAHGGALPGSLWLAGLLAVAGCVAGVALRLRAREDL
jgi:imidazolonepropionase-like amidohydrolase